MEHDTLLTGRSGQLHGQLWVCQPRPRGVVIVVHGLGDHGGRYESLARSLEPDGWALLAFDLPGHGLSPGARGQIDSFDGLLQDIAAARQTAGQRLGRLPQVLLGQSMGGNLVVNYALRRQEFEAENDRPVGLALSAPMMLPPSPPRRPHIFAAWLTGKLIPSFRVRRAVDTSVLTSDPEQAAAIQKDSLMHSRISIYLATQLLSQGRWALDEARQIGLPTLILCGEDDQLIDRSACENLAIRIGSPASLVRFPGMRHDLFHESQSDQVVKSFRQWLDGLSN